mmetsp:Transcript_3964/g.12323  ORF Transcript_3964/g.12323 Transcript_3964/m.12323 type:complete len:90 (+) Transcript_3964:1455-1724(+)
MCRHMKKRTKIARISNLDTGFVTMSSKSHKQIIACCVFPPSANELKLPKRCSFTAATLFAASRKVTASNDISAFGDVEKVPLALMPQIF